ncbi:MAG: pentapeptide repeat-containing protein [Chloroflexi bacterium]|nr:pentapeptide repeat-containing protein [Chloroflexota bacterium]
MADARHLAILKQGVGAWNEWRRANPGIFPDLKGENLSRLSLPGIDLRDADLLEANLRTTNLTRANLRGAGLIGAELDGADLAEADLSRAFMLEASLHHAHLPRAILRGASLNRVDLSEADLSGADLDGADLFQARMVETDLRGAIVSHCRVYGVAAWGVKLEGAVQRGLIITPPEDAVITVDDLEVAQFIYLLLNNKRIRDVIDTIARKVVLILGRFTEERKAVLDAIRDELRRRDYLPVLFDFDKPATRDFTETIRILAHLSRFIIADISDPRSIPQELQAVIPDLAVPVQPLLLTGQMEYGMFADLRGKYGWVLKTVEYRDADELLASLGEKVIAPAVAKAKELEKR